MDNNTGNNGSIDTTIYPHPLYKGAYVYKGESYHNWNNVAGAAGLDIRFRQSNTPIDNTVRNTIDLPCQLFVSPSSQYYLVYRFDDMDLRVDVHNAHTGRTIRDRGTTYSEMMDLVFSSKNSDWRAKNGWGKFNQYK